MTFEVQGHRGARGLKPENTLPSFEAALDAGADSIETDLHLTRDGVVVLMHDAVVSEQIYRLIDAETAPAPAERPFVSQLSLPQLRCYRGDLNSDPLRFPEQDKAPTPLSQAFCHGRGTNPYAVPALADLFAFAEAYAGAAGRAAGKSEDQRAGAGRLWFDLEIKTVPFFDADKEDGIVPALLDVVRAAGVVERTRVRSFDHRVVRRVRELEPALITAVLVAGTAPVDPVQLAEAAEARIYAPDYLFLDEAQVRRLHAAGIRVLPWTVNDAEEWRRLCAWDVDGITTDYPDRLAVWLRGQGGKKRGVGGVHAT